MLNSSSSSFEATRLLEARPLMELDNFQDTGLFILLSKQLLNIDLLLAVNLCLELLHREL
jgi:hypothetical protein